ncbi:hypothetical protein GW17_00014567 [Ensete ventricosum]|nr:hypothetical protein GW17_00014567 [Ensete ventricosum]
MPASVRRAGTGSASKRDPRTASCSCGTKKRSLEIGNGNKEHHIGIRTTGKLYSLKVVKGEGFLARFQNVPQVLDPHLGSKTSATITTREKGIDRGISHQELSLISSVDLTPSSKEQGLIPSTRINKLMSIEMSAGDVTPRLTYKEKVFIESD